MLLFSVYWLIYISYIMEFFKAQTLLLGAHTAFYSVHTKQALKASLDSRVALPFTCSFEENNTYKRGLHSCERVNAEAVTYSNHAC